MVFTPDYTGFAPYYNPGVMERVSIYRGMPIADCMVSSPYYEIGDILLVASELHVAACRKTDTSHPRDSKRHKAKKRIIEFDYISARKFCKSLKDRPEKCPITVRLLYKYKPQKDKQHGYKQY